MVRTLAFEITKFQFLQPANIVSLVAFFVLVVSLGLGPDYIESPYTIVASMLLGLAIVLLMGPVAVFALARRRLAESSKHTRSVTLQFFDEYTVIKTEASESKISYTLYNRAAPTGSGLALVYNMPNFNLSPRAR